MKDDEESPKRGRRHFMRTSAVATAGVLAGCGGGTMSADAGDASDGGPAPVDDAGAVVTDAGADAGAGEDAGTPPREVVPPEETEERDVFGLGIASGDVVDQRATLWTRYDGEAALAVALWEMDGETYARELFQTAVTPADGGFVHHEVADLTPGARYRYAFFEVEGEVRTGRSAVGRFRASLAPDALEPLVVGAVSCTSNGRSKTTLERAGERDDLDVFLLLGDTTYNDGDSSLSEFRSSWANSLGSAGWRATRRATSVLATWDDHEVDNNFDPVTRDLTAPTQAFFENLPLRRDATAPDRIWKSVRWGLTAEIFVLDCRSERRPDEGLYLSRAQMDWLKAGLSSSPCVFKLIVNSVPISDFPFPSASDRWEGYPAQREEILSFIDESPIDGVLWVAGDFHLASFGRVSRDGFGANQREVLVGPGAQTSNPGWLLLQPPQFEWATGTNNYTTLELEPTRRRIRIFWNDSDGAVVEVREINY